MAEGPGDLAVAAFTMYDAWFLESYNDYIGPDYRRLMMQQELGDNEGDQIDTNWLGAAPQLRQWDDEKRPKGLNNFEYLIKVKDFEATIEIYRNTFKDGKWRQYESRIREMGQNSRRHPWKMVTEAILLNTTCYDGKAFFAANHEEGSSGVQANIVNGTGTSEEQIATDYFAVSARMSQLKDDQGEYWGGIRPDFLMIPPALEKPFAKLANQTLTAGGETNILKGKFDYEIEPRLSDGNDWYAFHTSREMKPFVFLEREPPHPVNLIDPEASVEVFMRKRLFFSVEARRQVGYGLWQYAIKVTNA